MDRRKDKSNELSILSDNTTIVRRFIADRFERKNISEEQKNVRLSELTEKHNKDLLEILTKYGND